MDDKNNPAIVKKVFKTLAKIHSLDVPIKKNGKQFVELLDKSNPESIERFNKLIEENNCQTLKKYDLKTEFDWIKQIIEKLDSPLVFCHMDYRSSNLMITEPNNELVVCDFDESSYGNRGLDFSKLIKEWNSSHFFLNMDNIEGQPLGDELRPYIKAYVEECQRIHGKDFIKNPNNSVEHIMKEAKVFLLLTYLLYAADMRATRKTENSLNPKVLMEWAETNYKNYITVKGILKEQKLFD